MHQYAESLALTTRAQHFCKLAQSKLGFANNKNNTNNPDNTKGASSKPHHPVPHKQESSPPALEIQPPLLSNLSTLLTSMSTYYQAMYTLAQQFAIEAEQAAKINHVLTAKDNTKKNIDGGKASSNQSASTNTVAAVAAPAAVAIPMDIALKRFNPAGTHPDQMMTYPPTDLLPIPLKPVVLDVAWNYIDYDDVVEDNTDGSGAMGRGKKEESKMDGKEGREKEKEKEKDANANTSTGRRGWFGFGRG